MNHGFSMMDCTLRDGGYINDWNFGVEVREQILRSLVSAGIDMVECGYVSSTAEVRSGMTRFSSLGQVDELLASVFLDTPVKSSFCVMINHGEYDVRELAAFEERQAPQVAGIRLAFHKEDIAQALMEARVIVSKGYKLFVQPMAIVRYSDAETIKMLEAFRELAPFAVYIVDSFGSLHRDEFKRLLYLFKNNISEQTCLGYHSHNNLQLAYSNTIDFLEDARHQRVIVDASIFGMGRGAGNLNTELLGDYLNRDYNANYRIEELLDVIDDYLDALHRQSPWGYSVAHFLSASFNCHPNYATYLLDRKKLPVSGIHSILSELPVDCGQRYDEKLISALYDAFRASSVLPCNMGAEFFEGRRVILVASGPSSVEQREAIRADADTDGALLVALNHIPEVMKPDYFFFSNQKRFNRFRGRLVSSKTIVTSNIEIRDGFGAPHVVDYTEVFSASGSCSDNAAVLAIGMLIVQGYDHVSIAGLDGYDVSMVENYAYFEPSGVLDAKTMMAENVALGRALRTLSSRVKPRFITKSRFQEGMGFSVCAIIPARFASSRFEGKPLAPIAGKPMLQRTYEQTRKCRGLDRVIVATDDERIEQFCNEHGMDVMMTSSDCLTGTDRLAEVADKVEYDLYVNVQGDEPVIDPSVIDAIMSEYAAHGNRFVAYNLYKRIENREEEESPTIIKVIVDNAGELVYMSRLPVPFSKDDTKVVRHKQVCVYGYTREALRVFASSEKTANEAAEDIEILRFMDFGYRVRMIETECSSIAVDVPSDIQKVEAFLTAGDALCGLVAT